ncbi:IclR family transcriptional regulator C-terminal domain-containing protein [Streptomyces sp. NPDC059378]|uniref:IclR family transcriptional regulator domain-containing protein n=1 Tax=Streptomyces sp. NPDC059378 TaxID=3346815 RepID=UPI0036CBF05F
MPTTARASHFVRSFERGLAVIRSFDAERPARTLSEVARACGLPRAAVRRLLLTLVDLGYVHSDGRLFRLTPRVLELGYAYLAGLTLPQIARPHLEQLVADVKESSSLCLLDGDDIVYVARVPTRRIMSESITVGTRFPALVTSVGRAILAHAPDEDVDARLARACPRPLTARTIVDPDALRAELRRVRRQGHAVVDQELEEGLRSVAVPVRGRDGAVVAGVNIAVHAGRTTVAAVRRDLLPPLLATVARIEADLRITDPAPAAAEGPRGPHPSGPPPTPAG